MEHLRGADMREMKTSMRKKAVTRMTVTTKTRMKKIPHCQRPVNHSSYCQKQMGSLRLLCTLSHNRTIMDLPQSHIVHPPDLVLHTPTTHLPPQLILHVLPYPPLILAFASGMLMKALTFPALAVPAEIQLSRPVQNGGKGPRQASRKDEVYTARGVTPAPHAASGWSSKSHYGRKRQNDAKRKRDSRRKTRGGSRWPRERLSHGCKTSRLASGRSTMRPCRRTPMRNAWMQRSGRGRPRCYVGKPRWPSGRSRWLSGRLRFSVQNRRCVARNARHVAKKKNCC
ncbi:hypothetical protein EI94DRAFT_1243091 [Lactarius quietus]|nr:hypothetical protein EI94DRAFT_835265 [Lactarius quietus]KAF8267958.1 hypothetical protein EI94DRAFT_1243091 [Lactarius quietus]